jgi:hypothetical protein
MRGMLIATADRLEAVGTKIKRRADRRRVADRVTLGELEARGWTGVAPTFVLSTGRCGTRLLTELLEAGDGAAVHHSPRPELVRVSRRAYEQIDGNRDLFVEVLKSAREELLHEAVRYGQAFVETNNRITFLAPAAATAFPEARFIHLIRHPADIVRSGIRRGWYSGQHAHDLGRIEPVPGTPAAEGWRERDPIWKIGWMWNETNAFIDRFLATLPEERYIRSRAEVLFNDVDEAERLVRFCGIAPADAAHVRALLSRPVNAQRTGDFPKVDQWTDAQRELLRDAAPLATAYGYDI